MPAPWECYLLPVSEFPLKDEELPAVTKLILNLTEELAAQKHLSSEVFVQVEQSDETDYRRLFAVHARDWIPEVGLGVWPDREPPAVWTPEEFMNAAPTGTLRPLFYQVLRITTSPKARREARDLMIKYGPALEIMTSDETDTFLEKARRLLLPPITDPSYTCYPFYVPLLEVKSLTAASAEQLTEWFCGASLYLRESFEDTGVLIASSIPMKEILGRAGAQFDHRP
jgi:hypothetical protein